MNKRNIIGAAAVAAASIATYFIHKKLRSRKEKKEEHRSLEPDRHITKVFSRAKLTATT